MENLNQFFYRTKETFAAPDNVLVYTTYQGKRIGEDFFVKNPEKRILYPDKGRVTNLYATLKHRNTNKTSIILVTEEHSILYKPDAY